MVVVILGLLSLVATTVGAIRRLLKPKTRTTRTTQRRPEPKPTTEQVEGMAPESASAPSASPVYSTDLTIMQRRVAEAEANASEGLYDGVVGTMIVLSITAVIVILAIAVMALTNDSFWMMGIMLILDAVLASGIFLYTKMSLHQIQTNDLAILLVLGKYVRRLKPGLVYAPYGLCQVFGETTEEFEFDLPASQGRTFYGDLKDVGGVVPNDKVLAEIITLSRGVIPEGEKYLSIKGQKRQADGTYHEEAEIGRIYPDDEYLAPQAVRGEYSIGFVIEDILALYLAKGENIDNVVESISDHALPRFNEVLARMCPAEAKIRTKESSREVMDSLIDYTKNWGIRVTFARIKPLQFSHDFNKKVSEAASAVPAKRAAIIQSEGRRDSRKNDGLGEGDFERNRLKGLADGQKELIAASAADGGRTQAIQAVAGALGQSQLIVAEPSNLLGAVASGAAVLKNFHVGPTQPPAPPTGSETPAESRIILTDSPQAHPTGRQNPNQGPRENRGPRRRRA